MATAIQISNIALNNIGDGTITDFDDANARARACKLRFEDVRDAVLRSHPWNCMTRRKELSKSTETPVFEFDYAYIIDNTDILRVLSLYESDQYDYPFKVEGGFYLLMQRLLKSNTLNVLQVEMILLTLMHNWFRQ